ncbi:MAG: hypothetical protein HKO66_00095 [Saprospiraceae bacterium]|nr:hypothetical protein [Bacteroidia bacterium]NNE14835.1 hypothetical protein [Saprospiraceae bacterium]NNL90606.1 hypothetical protein [Saprospiraceae bacterium]
MKSFRLLLPIIAILLLTACSNEDVQTPPPPPTQPPEYEPIYDFTTFTFSSNGMDIKGKIYLPPSHVTNSDLPAIYLIDYKEQHFQIAEDEFDQVIKGVEQINNFDALVITLEEHSDIDANPNGFLSYYQTFKDMTKYVDSIYTSNTNRTFIGRGSEGGIVLLTFLSEDSATSVFDNFIATDSPSQFNNVLSTMIENDVVPENISNKKLHFSFSSSNDADNCNQLINLINSKQYPWLTFKSREYSMDTYENVYTYSFAEGLSFVF